MDRSNSLSESSWSSSSSPSPSSSNHLHPRISSSSSHVVVSIECLKGGSRAGEWTGDMLQTGDIVEELKIGSMMLRAPFKNGKSGLHKILHSCFKNKQTSINVRVRRGTDEFVELQTCLVPSDLSGKKHYMLRSIDDPNYAVGFSDRTEEECFQLQATRGTRLADALAKTRLQDGYVSYPWQRKMQESLSVPNSSSFYSMLMLPKADEKVAYRYNDVEDTLARANAWLNASQESGVPIVFMNVQTESLLTKISGEAASATVNAGSISDLSHIANASLYGFEDYHGVDIGVVRAVRLWFSPLGGDIPVEIIIKDYDTKLGFTISRTAEGFIHISSVLEGDDDTPASRSGLNKLLKESRKEGKLLVVSRIFNQKVLPWMVSATGAIRCFDTVSLSQKLSLHRHAKASILLHVFLWDRSVNIPDVGSIKSRAIVSPSSPSAVVSAPPPLSFPFPLPPDENRVFPMPSDHEDVNGGSPEVMMKLQRDTAGELSFRFRDFSVPNNWV